MKKSGGGFGFEVVREALGTFRYNSIGSYVKGGAYRTYGWVDPARNLVGTIFMQRTNGGGDTADEINSFMAISGGYRTVKRQRKRDSRPVGRPDFRSAFSVFRKLAGSGTGSIRLERLLMVGPARKH
jgi:CubicO group peptidase (beta-lactamase class C family)